MGRFLDIAVPTEPVRDPGAFHLTDPATDGAMAYSFLASEQDSDSSLADVESQVSLRFTPIDNNAAFEALEQDRNRRCDGYLRTEDASGLVFVELKHREATNATSTKTWVAKAINQLRQTIVVFRREEPEKSNLSAGGFHCAYVCNPKGPYQVPVSVRSTKKVFLSATKNFLLFCTNKIRVPA